MHFSSSALIVPLCRPKTNSSSHGTYRWLVHRMSIDCQPVWPSRPIFWWTCVGFAECFTIWICLLRVNLQPIQCSEVAVFPSRSMVFVNHQLLSGDQWCSRSPAELCPAWRIVALIFPAKVSCNSLLSLSQNFFCQVSVVCLDAEVVKSELKVLEVFWHISTQF